MFSNVLINVYITVLYYRCPMCRFEFEENVKDISRNFDLEYAVTEITQVTLKFHVNRAVRVENAGDAAASRSKNFGQNWLDLG